MRQSSWSSETTVGDTQATRAETGLGETAGETALIRQMTSMCLFTMEASPPPPLSLPLLPLPHHTHLLAGIHDVGGNCDWGGGDRI